MAKLDGQRFGAVFLDFSKAYDRVSVPKLIIKLRRSGLNPALIASINNWLTKQKNRVLRNGCFS